MAQGRFLPKSRRVRVHEAGALVGSSAAAESALVGQLLTPLPAPVFQIDGTLGVTGTFGSVVDYIEDQSGSNNDADGIAPNQPTRTQNGFATARHGITFPVGSTNFLKVGQSDPLATAELGVVTSLGYSAFVRFKTTSNKTTENRTDINPPMTLVGNHNSWSYNNFGLNGGNVEYRWLDDNLGAWTGLLSTGKTLNDGATHTVAVTHSTGGVVTLYVDGVQVAQTSGTTFQALYWGFSYVGAGYLTDDGFEGDISDVLVYNEALTSEDIVTVHTYIHGAAPATGTTYPANASINVAVTNSSTAKRVKLVTAVATVSTTTAATASRNRLRTATSSVAVTTAETHTKLGNLTVADVLGTRLVRWYRDYAVGTWTDVQGGTNATQTVVASKPAALTTLRGQSYPDFDGGDSLNLGALTSLPAYSATHHAIWGCAIRVDGVNTVFIYGPDTDFYYINGSGLAFVANATSNVAINDGQWYRLIVARNATTDTTTMYINGVAQTTTSADNMGQDWKTSTGQVIGDRPGGGFALNGGLASMFWGYSTTTAFTAQDISDLDTALNYYLTAPPTTYSATASASIATTTIALGSRGKQATATSNVAITNSANARVLLSPKQANASSSVSFSSNSAARLVKGARASISTSFSTNVVGVSAIYYPTAETGVLHWHEADSSLVVVSGGKVSSWPDDSNSGDPARVFSQPTGSCQPTYTARNPQLNNKPSIDFNGTTTFMDTRPFTGGPYSAVTHYFAATWTFNGLTSHLFDKTPSVTNRQALINTNLRDVRTIGVNPAFVAPRSGMPMIICTVFSGGIASTYVTDPADRLTSDIDTNTFESMRIGLGYADSGWLSGSIAAIGSFQGAHDLSTRSRIFQYLLLKYFESNDPARNHPEMWWQGSYPGTSWPESSPSPVSHDLTAVSAPSVGSSKNGYASAQFNGTTNAMNGPNSLNVVAPNSGTIAVYFNAASASDGTTFNTIPGLISDTSGYLGLGFSSAGVIFGINDGAEKQITIPCSTGSYHLAQAKWDGTNIWARVDDGAWTSVAAGSITAGFEFTGIRIGKNYNSTKFFSGSILEIIGHRRIITNEELDSYYNYVRLRYSDRLAATANTTPSITFSSTATATVSNTPSTRNATSSATIVFTSAAAGSTKRAAVASANVITSVSSQASIQKSAAGASSVVVTTSGTAARARNVTSSQSIVVTTISSAQRLRSANASTQIAFSNVASGGSIRVTNTVASLAFNASSAVQRIRNASASVSVVASTASTAATNRGMSTSATLVVTTSASATRVANVSSAASVSFSSVTQPSVIQGANASSTVQFAADGAASRTRSANAIVQITANSNAVATKTFSVSSSQTVSISAAGTIARTRGVATATQVFVSATATANKTTSAIAFSAITFAAEARASRAGVPEATALITISSSAWATATRVATAPSVIQIVASGEATRFRSTNSAIAVSFSTASDANRFRNADALSQVTFVTLGNVLRTRSVSGVTTLALSTNAAGGRFAPGTVASSISFSVTANGARFASAQGTSLLQTSIFSTASRIRGADGASNIIFTTNSTEARTRAADATSTIAFSASAQGLRQTESSQSTLVSFFVTAIPSTLRAANSAAIISVTTAATLQKFKLATATSAATITTAANGARFAPAIAEATISITSAASSARFATAQVTSEVAVSTSASATKNAAATANVSVSVTTNEPNARFTGQTTDQSASADVSIGTSATASRLRSSTGFSVAAWTATVDAQRLRSTNAISDTSVTTIGAASKIYGAVAPSLRSAVTAAANATATRAATGFAAINFFFSAATYVTGRANISVNVVANAELAPTDTGDIISGLINGDPTRPIRPPTLRRRGSSSSSSGSSASVFVTLKEINQKTYEGLPIRGAKELIESTSPHVKASKPRLLAVDANVLVEAKLQEVTSTPQKVSVVIERLDK